MTSRLRRYAIVLLIAASYSLIAAGPNQTVILVRHAERAEGTGDDVPISEAGRCRAEGLARMLADSGIRHIYVSEVARAQQTAQPLADRLKIRPAVVQAADYDALLDQLKASGTSLVVSHSNRLPEIIKRLGGGAVLPIGDNEFDRMFILTRVAPNRATLVTLRYPGCAQ